MTGIRGWLETLPEEALDRILTLPMGAPVFRLLPEASGPGCLMQVAANDFTAEAYRENADSFYHPIASRYDRITSKRGAEYANIVIRNRVLRIQARRILSVPS